jgi:hypothetical protein
MGQIRKGGNGPIRIRTRNVCNAPKRKEKKIDNVIEFPTRKEKESPTSGENENANHNHSPNDNQPWLMKSEVALTFAINL